jgi:chaperonin GroEL
MIAEYSDGYILLTDQRIHDPDSLIPIVSKIKNADNKPLLIIADDVVGNAMNSLIVTRLKQNLKVVAVKAPEYAERRLEMLEDLAILTGGIVISSVTGKKLEDVQIGELGRFDHIFVDSGHTAITPKNPDKEEINDRVAILKEQFEAEKNEIMKKKLQSRIAKLSQGVAVIRVGGGSLSELGERKDRHHGNRQDLRRRRDRHHRERDHRPG